MVNRILDLMAQKNITAKKLTTETGLASSVITEWKKGRSKPSAEAIIKIAEYFGVTTDYILTGKEPEPVFPAPHELTQNEKELLAMLHRFDERTQLKFLGRVETIVNEMDKENRFYNVVLAARKQTSLEATNEQLKILGDSADKAPNRAHDDKLF